MAGWAAQFRTPEELHRLSTTPEQPWPGPLSAEVARLCKGLRPQVSESTAEGFAEVLHRLRAPLQVAVAGRIKSGKSTLVNALIGRRVAPTDIGECTRLVTRFQYGTVDRVEVVFHTGERQAVPFEADGGIPAELGVDIAEVSHLEAYLTNAVLQDLTVIDTPGLGSLDSASVARTEELLGTADELDPVSRNAVAGAEAVLYVVTQGVRADDEQALTSFTAATASREAGPINALAVLNKADTIEADTVSGSGGQVWRAAELLAGKQAELLKPKVADVLPVIGLLAETVESGEFTAEDAEALRSLAGLDAETRETLLLSADLFTSWECPVPAGTRSGLLERFDLYGVRCALEIIDESPEITAGDLRRRLKDLSGLAEVLQRLHATFRARADGIKAAAALASLTALAHASGDLGERQQVHDAIEGLLTRTEAHQLRVLEALTQVAAGAVEMPSDLAEEVLRVGGSTELDEQLGLPGRQRKELADYALERANWWRSFSSFGSTPAQARVAHVVHRAYFLIWQQLRER